MKRSLDTIRAVLEFIEENGSAHATMTITHNGQGVNGVPDDEFDYHFQLCLDENLIIGKGGNMVTFKRLTSRGHDYLDLMRSDTVWKATREKIGTLGGWSLDIVGEVLKQIAKEKLGLN